MRSQVPLKGKLGDFFLFVQSFYRPKTKTTFNRQFSPKSPKMGQKSGQRVQNSQNKDPTVNSGFRPTVGIHQFWLPSYCGNPFFTNSASDLLWESINSVLRPTVGIHQFCPPSYCGNPLEYIQQLSAFRFYWARSPEWKYQLTLHIIFNSNLHICCWPLSSWTPCSCRLPRGTSLEFWPLEKRRNVKWFELWSICQHLECEMEAWMCNGMSIIGNLPMHAGTTALLPFPILPWRKRMAVLYAAFLHDLCNCNQLVDEENLFRCKWKQKDLSLEQLNFSSEEERPVRSVIIPKERAISLSNSPEYM